MRAIPDAPGVGSGDVPRAAVSGCLAGGGSRRSRQVDSRRARFMHGSADPRQRSSGGALDYCLGQPNRAGHNDAGGKQNPALPSSGCLKPSAISSTDSKRIAVSCQSRGSPIAGYRTPRPQCPGLSLRFSSSSSQGFSWETFAFNVLARAILAPLKSMTGF